MLEHFRSCGHQPRSLYERHGLCVDIVGIDTRISHAFHMDDLATATVTPVAGTEGELAFTVSITVQRDGKPVHAVTSTVGVALRSDPRGFPAQPPPAELAGYLVPEIKRGAAVTGPAPAPGGYDLSASRALTGDPVLAALTEGSNAVGWKWRIPYFYCHFTERMQMSGYLRVMEEIVDLFLAERNASIKTLLDEQNWIPVVPRSVISMTDEAYMEEDLYTVFTVEDVFKDFTYTARMDCYVLRDGSLLQTATGRITHGYAVIRNRADWALVRFDDRLLKAVGGGT